MRYKSSVKRLNHCNLGRFAWLAGALAVAAVSVMAGPAALFADDSAVVARVNGHAITERDIRMAEKEIGGDLQQVPKAHRRKVLIEFLISNQLFAEAAAAKDVATSGSFKKRMDYWRRRMLRDTYFDGEVQKSVSEADARAHYDAQIKKFPGGPEVKASHILVENEDLAKEIFEKIAHGAGFADLARKHSKDPGSGRNGGSLGYFGKGRMVPVFEKTAFSLDVGEVSQPVKSRFGWHLIKVEDKRNRQPPPFAEVRARVIRSLAHQRARDIEKALRAKAKIEYAKPAQ